jgi:hypothetical protein
MPFLSEATIEEMEAVGSLIFGENGAAALCDLVNTWVAKQRSSPLPDKPLPKKERKRQTRRHTEIADTADRLADLINDELQAPYLKGSLVLRRLSEVAKKPTLPTLWEHLRFLADLARQKTPPPLVRPRGRPSDGLNELIRGYAPLFVAAGGTIRVTSAEVDGSVKAVPGAFHKTLKVMIDSLPDDFPKLPLQAIADRVSDHKLAAGYTVRSPQREAPSKG